MEQNKKLLEALYNYYKNGTDETKTDFDKEWHKVADTTTEEAKAFFGHLMENEKMQELLCKMNKEQQEGTIKFLSQTLAYIFLEKNTTGTTGVLEKLKEFRG